MRSVLLTVAAAAILSGCVTGPSDRYPRKVRAWCSSDASGRDYRTFENEWSDRCFDRYDAGRCASDGECARFYGRE